MSNISHERRHSVLESATLAKNAVKSQLEKTYSRQFLENAREEVAVTSINPNIDVDA